MANKQNKAIVKNDVVEYFKDKLTNIKEDADWTAFSNNLFTGTSGEKKCLVTQDINTSHIPEFLAKNHNSHLIGGIVVFGKNDSYPSIQLGNTPNKLVSYSEINVPITSFGFQPHITLTLYYSDKQTKISKQVSKTSTIFGVTYDTNWDCVRGAVSGSTLGNVVLANRLAYAIGEIPDNTKIVSFKPKVTVKFTDDTGTDTYCKWNYTNLQKYSWVGGNYDLMYSWGLGGDSSGNHFEVIGKENALTKNGLTTGYTFSFSFPSPIAKGKIYIHRRSSPSKPNIVLNECKLFATIAPNVDMTVTLSYTDPSGVRKDTFIIPAGKRYSDISSELIRLWDTLVSYEASGGELFYEYTWGGVVDKVIFLE